MTNESWFGVRVRPKGEARASNALSMRGFEAFLPTRKVRRHWSDRVKTLDEPLFPGYLFCRFDPRERIRILDVPAVIQIVGIASTPVPVSDAEISALQTMVTSRLMLTPWPYLSCGQQVRIGYGPLTGVQGIVTRAEDGNPRVVVSITLLQRSVATEIERDWIC